MSVLLEVGYENRSFAIASLIAVPILLAQGPPEDSNWLTPGKLTRAGLHFKAGISTLSEQGKDQANVFTEILTVEWNSLPGISKDAVRSDEVRDIAVSSNFAVLERKTGPTGIGFGRSPLLTSGELVTVATTSEDEIRSVSVLGDPRLLFTEDLAHQKPRIELVRPKVTFEVVIPDDPKVVKLVFLMPVADKEHVAVLNKIAEFKLPEHKKP